MIGEKDTTINQLRALLAAWMPWNYRGALRAEAALDHE
jgi:hypothetical protein